MSKEDALPSFVQQARVRAKSLEADLMVLFRERESLDRKIQRARKEWARANQAELRAIGRWSRQEMRKKLKENHHP